MRNSQLQPRLTLQQLLSKHLPDLQDQFNGHQLRVLNALSKCKTADLGGHKEQCSSCGHTKIHYNSCGNRHCPGCQGANRERWLMEREHDLFDVPYHHVVFTLPSQLRQLFYHNQKLLYNLLFESMWGTLLSFSKDKRSRLQAQIGVIAILHTWTQQLDYHPHLHCLVPSGGFKNGSWKKKEGDFLFSVKALSVVFKQKLCDGLKKYFQNQLLHTELSSYDFERFITAVSHKKWVIYSKPGFRGKESVLEYLGRYTHRIAISNYRLLSQKGDQITFSYRDRKAGDVKKTKTLRVKEFLTRFSYHILPRGFVKIRSYGLFANRNKQELLPKVFEALKQIQPPKEQKLSLLEVVKRSTGTDLTCCPKCKAGKMLVIEELPPANKGSPRMFTALRRKEVLCSW